MNPVRIATPVMVRGVREGGIKGLEKRIREDESMAAAITMLRALLLKIVKKYSFS